MSREKLDFRKCLGLGVLLKKGALGTEKAKRLPHCSFIAGKSSHRRSWPSLPLPASVLRGHVVLPVSFLSAPAPSARLSSVW